MYLAREQALQKGLPLVAGAVLQVLQGGHRPVCEGVQVLGKAALYDACTTNSLFLLLPHYQGLLSQPTYRMVYTHLLHDIPLGTEFLQKA